VRSDLLDCVLQVVLVVCSNGDKECLPKDVRPILDGFVGQCGFVGAFLKVGTTDTLFKIGVDLKIVSQILEFVPSSLLILRRDMGRQIEFDVS